MDDIGVTELKLHQKTRILEVIFQDGKEAHLPCEYLRVYSPSAEVQGHGQEQAKLEWGKKEVNITAMEPVGHYGIKIIFSDGHSTGIYSWQTLHTLAENYETNWQCYLDRLASAGLSRESVCAKGAL